MGSGRKHIIIVGAGIIGLACAVRLTNSGHKVTLVDKGEPGKGTSFGNAGHIATEQIHPLASPQTIAALPRYLLDPTSPIKLPLSYLPKITPWLLRFAYNSRPSQFIRGTMALSTLQQNAMKELKELLKIVEKPTLLHQSGNLVVLENSTNIASARKEITAYQQAGIAAEWLSAKSVRDLSPDLCQSIVGAVYFTKTGHVSNPYSVSQALEAYLRGNGATIVKDEVLHIKQTENKVTVATTNQRFEADYSVIAAGAFSKKLATQAGLKMPLETERGYHIHMDGTAANFSLPVASYERKIIMTPMNDGVRATGIVEFGGLDMPPRQKNFKTLQKHAKSLSPTLNTDTASTWMGYRPSLPDHLPAIGYTGTGSRILCAFGHQHLGLTLSGITAKLVGDMVNGNTPSINISPFNPRRFT